MEEQCKVQCKGMIYINILYDVVYFILCTTHTYCIMHTVYNTLVLKTPQLQPSEELLIASTQTPTELRTTSNTTCTHTCNAALRCWRLKHQGSMIIQTVCMCCAAQSSMHMSNMAGVESEYHPHTHTHRHTHTHTHTHHLLQAEKLQWPASH